MSKTTIDVLTADDVVARFTQLRSRQPVNYFSFYSSQMGGIVTDPALMVIPFDDHMVHRGHGIFDTAGLIDGKIWSVDDARLIESEWTGEIPTGKQTQKVQMHAGKPKLVG